MFAMPTPEQGSSLSGDPLAIAALVAMIIVGVVVIADILQDGKIDPSVLALMVSVLGPLTPALLLRTRRKDE